MGHGCGKLFVPTWWKARYEKFVIQYDKAVWEGDETDWPRMAETIRIACPHCGEKHPDIPRVRRTLTKFDRAAMSQLTRRETKRSRVTAGISKALGGMRLSNWSNAS